MSESKNTQNEFDSKKNKLEIKVEGVDIDKNEYLEIVLSNSNFPENSFYEKYR